MTNDLDSILNEYADTTNDFGFTEVSEAEFNSTIEQAVTEASQETEAQTTEQYKEKLLQVEKLILPFLIKLMNAKEVYIKWPHEVREPVIKDQIEKILAITRS